jgi:hypothetical protein
MLETVAMLGIYDLETGERQNMIDLQADGGRHFINDIAVDGEGNVYMTDSIAPIIFKVDTEGEASILVKDERFIGEVDFGNGPFPYALNGIAYHPDGYLIVASSANNALFKVTMGDMIQVTPVELEQPIVFPDGLVIKPDGQLIVVSGLSQTVFLLTSDDNWASATTAVALPVESNVQLGQTATTAAVRDGEVYTLLTSFSPEAPAGSYQIQWLNFDSMR